MYFNSVLKTEAENEPLSFETGIIPWNRQRILYIRENERREKNIRKS